MINKEALTLLADLLEKDANDREGMKFDLGCLAESSNGPPKLDCNTMGCGMGLAALSGAFPRLTYTVEGETIGLLVDGWIKDYIEAANELFGIDYCIANELFSPGHSNRPHAGAEGELALAEAIRKVVAAAK